MNRKHRIYPALTLTLIAALLGLLIWGIVLVFGEDIDACRIRAEQRDAVEAFRENMDIVTPAPEELTEPEEPSEPEELTAPEELTELWRAMRSYNDRIYADGQSRLVEDPFSETVQVFDLEDFGLEDAVFGVLSIPKMDVELPIRLGSSLGNMSHSAAQLTETSVPIGGLNTNAVFAIHREYVMDIECLEAGDLIYIQNPWETLTYKVTSLRLIEPSDREAVKIEDGKDQITLMTCHPWGSGGRYRYLVFAERAEATEADIAANHPESLMDRVKRQWNNKGAEDLQVAEGAEYIPSQREVLLKALLPQLCATVIALLVLVIAVWGIAEIRRKKRRRNASKS